MSKAVENKGSSLSEDHDDVDSDENVVLNKVDKPQLLAIMEPINLPAVVKRRVKALKKLQLESVKLEAKFFEEVHALEMKYYELYKPQYTKRSEIVTGAYEPNDEECDFDSDAEISDGDLSSDVKKLNIKDIQAQEEANTMKGIPNFWITIFRNVSLLQEMLEDHDVPVLQHLEDITVELTNNPMGFKLFFHFSPNEYFSNSVLTKEYELKCVPDEGPDAFDFEGPAIIKCKGCPIDWAKGKNVTVKMMKKKQKHKGRGEVRTVTKTIRRDSFFNFFAPPTVSDDPHVEIDDDIQTLLNADFEIGHYLRERIIPRAVLYFTGEALDEEEEEEEEEDDDDNDDDEDDDDDEGDHDVVNKKNRTNAGQRLPANPAECKQQ